MRLFLLLFVFSFCVFAQTKVPIEIKTNKGSIFVELNQTKAPVTVKNFLKYIDKNFYDGLIFHRVIENFMIQGGGLNKKLEEKKAMTAIINEAKNGLANDKGTIAMARTSNPNSATNQFFINAKDNHFLNYQGNFPGGYGYAVFGKVTKGMSVLKKIEKVKIHARGMHQHVPVDPITIKSIRRIK